MAYEFHFDHDHQLVVVTFSDEPDQTEVIRAMTELTSQAEFVPGCRILVDVQAISSVLPSFDVVRGFARLHAGHPEYRRCALAIAAGRAVNFGLANMYATLCGFNGLAVGAFKSFEQAEAWLCQASTKAG